MLDFILFYYWIIRQKIHSNQAENQQLKYNSKPEAADRALRQLQVTTQDNKRMTLDNSNTNIPASMNLSGRALNKKFQQGARFI